MRKSFPFQALKLKLLSKNSDPSGPPGPVVNDCWNRTSAEVRVLAGVLFAFGLPRLLANVTIGLSLNVTIGFSLTDCCCAAISGSSGSGVGWLITRGAARVAMLLVDCGPAPPALRAATA